MQAEDYRYTLQIAGRPVGEQHWTVTPDRHHWVARVQTDYSGSFMGGGRRIQVSRIHPQSRVSAAYLESAEGGKGRSSFETVFDRKTGLLTLRQGRDEAEIPLVRDYQDPLSLLHLLRELEDDIRQLEVPMVGSEVQVQRLADSTLRFEGEDLEVRVYYLRPGRAVVYIEKDEPWRIVRLLQPLDASVTLEALLSDPPARGREVRREGEGKRRRRR